MAAGQNFAEFFLEGILTPILGIFGFFGNVLSIKVLSSKDLDMMPSIRHLLKMLAAFDAVFLVFTLTLFCISAWSENFNEFVRPWLTPYFLPVIQISLTGSVYATVAVSVERFLTVCCSFRHSFASAAPDGTASRMFHLSYTVPILVFSFAFNITRFFELTTVRVPLNRTESVIIPADDYGQINEYLNHSWNIYENASGTYANITTTVILPEVQPTLLRQNVDYSFYFVLMANSLGLVFTPIVVLIGLNSMIFVTINKATERHNAISNHQRRDHSVAMMLILIVVVFVICHSIRSVINAYEFMQFAKHGEIREWPDWVDALVHINHFALVVNSSINILIYACKDDKFLAVMLTTMGLKSRMPMRLRPVSHGNGRSSAMPRPSMTATTTVTNNGGVSSTEYISGKLLAPPQSSPLPTVKRIRSFDFGDGSERTNLLGTNSTSSTVITNVGSTNEVFSDLSNFHSIEDSRRISENKSWHKNVCSHPLGEIRNNSNNHSPSKKNGETVQSGRKNTESFEVLVTCVTPENSKNLEVAHKLLKQNEECKGNDKQQISSKHCSKAILIQTSNVDAQGGIELKERDINTTPTVLPPTTTIYKETPLCDRDCSDSRRSSCEGYICYCNGSNGSNACSCETARCEEDCNDSPIGSVFAEPSTIHQPCNGIFKEELDVIDIRMSSEDIDKDTAELLSPENSNELSNQSTSETVIFNDSQDNEFSRSLEPTELYNYNQRSTISTQTPSSSHV